MDKTRKRNIVLELNHNLNKLKSKSESSLPGVLAEQGAIRNGIPHHKAVVQTQSPASARPLTPSIGGHQMQRPFSIGPPSLTKLVPANDTFSVMRSKSPILPIFTRDSGNGVDRQPADAFSLDTAKPMAKEETKVCLHCSGPTKWRPDLSLKVDLLSIV